jgi:hypothetical protein
MIGILFHGPEVFDSGWARKIVNAFAEIAPLYCVLAGTMGQTAAIDSGLPDIHCPGGQPSQILREIQDSVDEVIFANYGKSESSGLLHGALVAAKANVRNPFVHIECSSGLYVEFNPGSRPEMIQTMEQQLGLQKHKTVAHPTSYWEKNDKTYRRITTAASGDFVLVDGIVVGRATGGEILIECKNGQIRRVGGTEIKTHGLEKLERLGCIDLKSVKLATIPSLRRTEWTPRITNRTGKGMTFIDHTAIHVYGRVCDAEGAVTVGDDTTAIVGDILYRFQKPIIGITDGDRDVILDHARMTSGSVVFTVRQDDAFGLRVFSEVFRHQTAIKDTFAMVRERICALVQDELVDTQEF